MAIVQQGWGVGTVCPGQGVVLTSDSRSFTGELVTAYTGEEKSAADSKSFSAGELVTPLTGEQEAAPDPGNDTFTRAESLTIVNT